MTQLRNKFVLALGLCAALLVLSFTIGGEFLHQAIHHHESQAAHEDCPFSQLLVQAIIFAAVVGLTFPALAQSCVPPSFSVVSHRFYLLPNLRGPPVSL